MGQPASAETPPHRSRRVRSSGVVAASVFVAWWLVLGVPPFWSIGWIVLFVAVLAAPGRTPRARNAVLTPSRGRLVATGLLLLVGVLPVGWLLQEAYDHAAAALVQRRVEEVLRRLDEWEAARDAGTGRPSVRPGDRIVVECDGWRVAADPSIGERLGALRELKGEGIQRRNPFWDIGGESGHVRMAREGSFARGAAELDIDFYPSRRDVIEIRWEQDPRVAPGAPAVVAVSVGSSGYWGRNHWKPGNYRE